MSDLGTEFTQLADCLDKSTGAKGVLMTVMNKAVLAPVALCVIIVIVASSSGIFSFSLLFVTNFSGQTISDNLLMVESALKIGGGLTGLLLGPKIGLKMLLLLGNRGKQNILEILILTRVCLFICHLPVCGYPLPPHHHWQLLGWSCLPVSLPSQPTFQFWTSQVAPHRGALSCLPHSLGSHFGSCILLGIQPCASDVVPPADASSQHSPVYPLLGGCSFHRPVLCDNPVAGPRPEEVQSWRHGATFQTSLQWGQEAEDFSDKWR